MEDYRTYHHPGTFPITTVVLLSEYHGQVSEEDVLEDHVGLHMGGGPFLLIYSRTITPEEENARLPWPEKIKVRHFF